MRHHIERVGPRPVKFRLLEVQHVQRLTPRYVRVVLGGEDLAGFESTGADDHVKLLFPDAVTGELVAPELGGKELAPSLRERMRDFTPRRFDGQTLTLDFALHGAGIANAWAEAAKPGARLAVGGPRGSSEVTYDYDTFLLAGDETALPAIARRLEELPADARGLALLEVETEADVLPLTAPPGVEVRWLYRRGGASLLAAALQTAPTPNEDTFVFVACEAAEARAARAVLQPQGRATWSGRIAAYWKRGVTDFHEGH